MIFGKHINRYYLKYLPMIALGVAALIAVDYVQLFIPELYEMVVNGMKDGRVAIDGVTHTFDMNFLLDNICMPMVKIILALVCGRFLWRVCLFGAAIKMETDLRNRMFFHAKDLNQQYYQANKVGNLRSVIWGAWDVCMKI